MTDISNLSAEVLRTKIFQLFNELAARQHETAQMIIEIENLEMELRRRKLDANFQIQFLRR